MRSAWMCLFPSATKSTSTAPTKGGVARIEFSRKRSWSHTLAQARGDSHAAVSQNSTTCASVRAQVRPKSHLVLPHCLEKSILPSDSPVGSTPIGDLSVVRVLRVCGWLHGRRRPVHDTPGRARGRRRWKLAECDAIASKRVSRHPILQLVRLQSETSALCVCCVSVDGCMVDGARFTILLAGLEVEGDGSSPSAMPRSAAEAIVQPSCVCLAS